MVASVSVSVGESVDSSWPVGSAVPDAPQLERSMPIVIRQNPIQAFFTFFSKFAAEFNFDSTLESEPYSQYDFPQANFKPSVICLPSTDCLGSLLLLFA